MVTLNSIMGKAGSDFKKRMRKTSVAHKKQMNKASDDLKKNLSAKSIIAKEGRVPIPAKRKHEVRDKFKNKCATRNCRGKPLQFHHKNAKNSDNRLANLILLCANHHYQKHAKGSKLNVKVKKRKARKKNNSLF